MKYPFSLAPAVWGLLRRYAKATRAAPRHFVIPTGLMLIGSAFEAATYALLLPITKAVETGGYSFLTQSRGFGWLLALAPPDVIGSPHEARYMTFLIVILLLTGRIFTIAVQYVRVLYIHARTERYEMRIAKVTLRRVLQFGRQFFNRDSLGSLDARMGWATGALRLVTRAEDMLRRLSSLIIKLTLMFLLSVPLSIAYLVTLPVVTSAIRWINTRVRRIASESMAIESDRRAKQLDLLGTIPLVKAYSQEDVATDAFEDILDQARGVAYRRERVAALQGPIEEILVLAALFSVQIMVMYASAGFQPADLATFAAVLLLLQQSLPDLRAITGFAVTVASESPRLEAVEELFSDEGKYIVPSGSRTFAGLNEGIEIRGLSFGYTDREEVLREIRATIPARKVTAIVGESGAGKTTLVDLLARFFDCPSNTVFVDGVDIREFSLESLHSRMAVVSQEVWLLNRSIRDNLIFGLDRLPTDDELWQALRDVDLGLLVEQLPQGLDTEVGDRGVRLSGGQRQRLALAQALLRGPEILILDEATSALDSVIEARIGKTIKKRAKDQTLIMIAHRLSTIRDADLILVLDDGRLVERGTWDELLSREGPFFRLHQAQYHRGSATDDVGPVDGAPIEMA